MANIAVNIPSAALEQIEEWADSSGLPSAEFYSTALILGARTMNSSLGYGFVDALAPEDRQYMSESANASVTPEMLLQIVLGGQARANAHDLAQTTTEVAITISDELVKQCHAAADNIAMARDKFYSLAFAMGARLAASTLENSRIFPLELLVQSTEGNVTPEMLMRALMGRNPQAKTKKPSDLR